MIKGAYRPIYSTLEEKRLWEDIKSGKGIPPIVETNIPLQKTYHQCLRKRKNIKKKYKEKYSWVSVKDRLPEVNKEVLVYLFSNNQPHIAWWNGTHWQTDEFVLDDCEYEPLAWFPLPEPYKGDN